MGHNTHSTALWLSSQNKIVVLKLPNCSTLATQPKLQHKWFVHLLDVANIFTQPWQPSQLEWGCAPAFWHHIQWWQRRLCAGWSRLASGSKLERVAGVQSWSVFQQGKVGGRPWQTGGRRRWTWQFILDLNPSPGQPIVTLGCSDLYQWNIWQITKLAPKCWQVTWVKRRTNPLILHQLASTLHWIQNRPACFSEN